MEEKHSFNYLGDAKNSIRIVLFLEFAKMQFGKSPFIANPYNRILFIKGEIKRNTLCEFMSIEQLEQELIDLRQQIQRGQSAHPDFFTRGKQLTFVNNLNHCINTIHDYLMRHPSYKIYLSLCEDDFHPILILFCCLQQPLHLENGHLESIQLWNANSTYPFRVWVTNTQQY